MKKLTLFALCICAVALAAIIPVSADDIAAPAPYSILLEDGAKLLCITPTSGYLSELYKDAPKSGLYYNELPLRNIYYFDDYLHEYNSYLHESHLMCSADGMYAALIPWAQNQPWSHQTRQFESRTGGEAILLFENGALIKSYTVGDFLKDESKARFSVSHVEWEDKEKRAFDPQSNVLTVTALDDLVYRIDITTGEMLGEAAAKPTIAATTSAIPTEALPKAAPEAPPKTGGAVYAAVFGVSAISMVISVVAIRRRRR